MAEQGGIFNLVITLVGKGAAWRRMSPAGVRTLALLVLMPGGLCGVQAQIAFQSAVALAVENSPRVKMAQDDVRRATAAVSEIKDAYIPSVGMAGGLGRSYGISLTVPTIFTVNAQSLIYSAAERSYIRAAKKSLEAANLSLQDARQATEEDAALTYITLDQAMTRDAVLVQESEMARQLNEITQQRLAAGVDDDLESKRTRRSLLQLRMQQPQAENDVASLRQHLVELTGVAYDRMTPVESSIPAMPLQAEGDAAGAAGETAGVLSLKANAAAKAQQAHGDSRYGLWPQVSMFSQYGRISPINNVTEYYNLNGHYNVMQFGVAVQIPLFDKVRTARQRETVADALHAEHDAQRIEGEVRENQLRLARSLTELSNRVELTELEKDIAHDELNAMLLEVKASSAGATGGRQMNPKDAIYERMAEKQRELDWLDATLQLHRTQITVLRLNGKLDDWLQHAAAAPAGTPCAASDCTVSAAPSR